MDTFMDKLAQKLTAQEIIKANTAADAEELKELKGQIREYHDCLAQMQEANQELRAVNDQMGKLVEEEIGPQIRRLVDSGVLKLEGAQVDTAGLEQMMQESHAQLRRTMDENSARIQKIADESGMQLQKVADESLQKLQEFQQSGQDMDEWKQVLGEKTEGINDYTHRECVKVYRNVQAVVVEAGDKQTENLNELSKTVKSKLGVVLGVSVAALVFSIAGVVLQLLSVFHIL